MSLVLDRIPPQPCMPPPPPPDKLVLASGLTTTQPQIPPTATIDRRAFLGTYSDALAYFDRGEWDRAEEALKRVVKIWAYSGLYVLIGYTYFYRGDFIGASNYFLKATQKNPQDLSAHFSLALAYNRLQKTDKAISAISKVISLYRDNANGQFFLGYLRHQLHQWDLAEEAYRQALRLNQDFHEVYQYLALMYFEMGDVNAAEREELFRHAIATYEELIRINPAASASYINIGYIYEQLGEPVQATEAYQKAVKIALSSEDLLGIITIGMELLEAGRFEEARTVFRWSLNVMKDSQSCDGISRVQILGWIGTSAFQLHNVRISQPTAAELLKEAEDSFREALALDPNYVHAQISIGAVYHAQGRIDDAVKAFERALNIAPNNETARANLTTLAEEKLEQKLHEIGLLKQIKMPITDFAPYRSRTPIQVRGEPVSETILEDRR